MSTGNGSGVAAVFVQTNEAEGNRVLAFRGGADGRLSQPESAPTGGAGDGRPHLPSQGSVLLAGDGTHLLVTNAGSDELSLFEVGAGLALRHVAPAGGRAPKSVSEHAGLVYVLNTGTPSLTGFRLAGNRLLAIDRSERRLAEDADPAQVGFSPDGSTLVVTERGTNTIVVYPVGEDGLLGEAKATPSSGPTPYGFTFGAGGVLVVTEAFGAEKGKAAASSYRLVRDRAEPVSHSVGNGRSEICWAVVTNDGRYAYTTNFADGAVSRYAIDEDGTIALDDAVAGSAVEGATGLRDEGISRDGRFLYALDSDARRIRGWAVDGRALVPLGSWDGLPATAAGLAAA